MNRANSMYPLSLKELMNHFERLPGVGAKTAAKLAFSVLQSDKAEAMGFANAIVNAKEKIKKCKVCFNWTDEELCGICLSSGRDKSLLCIVEDPRYLIAVEKTGQYDGLYHVLHGLISPMDGIGPDDLTISELIKRLEGGEVREIIVATNANIEGEATALYLSRIINPMGVKVSRLAYGIPVGGDLEYADEVTLYRAISGRNEI